MTILCEDLRIKSFDAVIVGDKLTKWFQRVD